MFKPYVTSANSDTSDQTLTIDFEGNRIQVPVGITVAAAVMGYAQKNYIRNSPVDGKKRAPFCFMGVCHECLMEIDGVPNRQACIMEVRQGMKIKRQTGMAEVAK